MVVVSHCMLNQNSTAPGLAKYPGVVTPLIKLLINKGYGIYQLPCPETTYLGLKRFWMTKEQYDNVGFRKHCMKLAENVAEELSEYAKNGYKVLAVIGVSGSPSCGSEWTSSGEWMGDPRKASEERRIRGSGVFIEELKKAFLLHGIEAPIIDYDFKNEKESLEKIAKVLDV